MKTKGGIYPDGAYVRDGRTVTLDGMPAWTLDRRTEPGTGRAGVSPSALDDIARLAFLAPLLADAVRAAAQLVDTYRGEKLPIRATRDAAELITRAARAIEASQVIDKAPRALIVENGAARIPGAPV